MSNSRQTQVQHDGAMMVTCLLCKAKISCVGLRDHISWEHFRHAPHKCQTCEITFRAGEKALLHSGHTRHIVILNGVSAGDTRDRVIEMNHDECMKAAVKKEEEECTTVPGSSSVAAASTAHRTHHLRTPEKTGLNSRTFPFEKCHRAGRNNHVEKRDPSDVKGIVKREPATKIEEATGTRTHRTRRGGRNTEAIKQDRDARTTQHFEPDVDVKIKEELKHMANPPIGTASKLFSGLTMKRILGIEKTSGGSIIFVQLSDDSFEKTPITVVERFDSMMLIDFLANQVWKKKLEK